MKITEIQDLIKFVARSGVTEVEIEQANFKIIIKSEGNKRKGQQPDMYMPQSMPIQQLQMQPVQVQQQYQQVAPDNLPAAAEPKKDKDAAGENNAKYVTVKSPMIGTFYRSPGPDKSDFVSVGDEIKPGKVICIIEAMKLFNEIEAETSGKIIKVLIDDATPVEYDQPLFLVDPS